MFYTALIFAYSYFLGRKVGAPSLQMLLEKLPDLTDSLYNIQLVGCGDNLIGGGESFDVIWPPKVTEYDPEWEILAEDFEREIDLSNNEFVDLARKYAEAAERLYRTLETDLRQPYSALLDELRNRWNNLERIGESIRYYLRKRSAKLMPKIRVLTKKLNDYSLVFKKEGELLALGDLSKDNINRLVDAGYIGSYYKALKAPHHGSKHNFTSVLPEADVCIVSNSCKKPYISALYGIKYADRMCCTNEKHHGCEYAFSILRCRDCRIGGPIDYRLIKIEPSGAIVLK